MSHDVCTNETELRSIVQQHVVELFCYPLSMYTSTLYHVNHLHTLMGEQAKEEQEGKEQESMMLHKHKLAVLASTAHTVSFFAKDFLYHLSLGGYTTSSSSATSMAAAASAAINYDNHHDLEVVFYSKIFKTRLWYQWLSQTGIEL